MESRIKLQPGESLKLEKSSSEGTMGQTEINCYSVIDAGGLIVGSVEHQDHMSLKGFTRTQRVTQRNKNGSILVNDTW